MINFRMNMPFYLMTFYGSIMICIVLLLRGLLKKKLPKFVFPVLWGVVLLRLLVPFSVSSPLSMKVPEFLILQTFYEESAVTIHAVAEDIPADSAMEGTGTATILPPRQTQPSAIQVSEIPVSEVQVSEDTAYASGYATSYGTGYISGNGLRKLYTLTPVIFLTGLLITTGILLAQKYSYSRRLKNSLLVEHNETVNTLLREMGMGHILVFTNDEIASPLVCGLLAPKIYLPTRMDFENTALLRHILCHETMHIRRKDNWLRLVMLLALCANWFNPLVWVMSKCLSADLETSCDEAVLRLYNDEEDKKGYALSLLAMAVSGSRPTLLYSAFSKTEVEKRIQNILHYKKASALLLAFSVCLVLGGSVVFATGGQAPFSQYLSAFCGSESCRWGIQAYLTRDIALGENAQKRADNVIFDIMRDDTTNDPDILEERIRTALADEFHVEKGAFSLSISLCLDRERLFEEYAAWGLVRKEKENDMLLYNGETIRTYSDEMLGRYYSQTEGAVDITIVRSRLGEITSVNAFHEGDTEFDRRTWELRSR